MSEARANVAVMTIMENEAVPILSAPFVFFLDDGFLSSGYNGFSLPPVLPVELLPVELVLPLVVAELHVVIVPTTVS
jgi:hypothetical protein